MAKLGYARVSSKTQKLDRQLEKLEELHLDKIFTDKESGSSRDRTQLNALLDYLREDDIVYITELDRLGRNSQDLTDIIDFINRKGAILNVLNLPTFNGIENKNLSMLLNNLITEIYKYQAEEERIKIRERQMQGIAIAKEKGLYKGKSPKYSSNDAKLLHGFELYMNGFSDAKIEKVLGINERTFRRYRKKHNIYRTSNKTDLS